MSMQPRAVGAGLGVGGAASSHSRALGKRSPPGGLASESEQTGELSHTVKSLG